MTIEKPRHELDFDGLDFTGRTTYGPGAGYRFRALAAEATLGNPVPIERELLSGLRDGSFVVTDGHGNREPVFQIQMIAPNSDLLAMAEGDLFPRLGRPVELGWKPPDGWGARTVYEVITSSMTHEFDGTRERMLVRAYRVRIIAHPFGFSEDEVLDVVSDAQPETPVSAVISNGTSATGWTSPYGAVTVASGRLQVPSSTPVEVSSGTEYPVYYAEMEATKDLDPDVDFTDTIYLSADVRFESSNQYAYTSVPFIYSAEVDDTVLQLVSYETVPSSDYLRLTWLCTDADAERVTIKAKCRIYGAPAAGLLIDNVERTNVPPSSSTSGRESLRTIVVSGSARTAASVAVEHETEGLGDTILYTSAQLANGYSPALLRWIDPLLTSSAEDDTSVSGARVTSTGSFVFNIPATSLPRGTHLLMISARTTDAVVSPFDWEVVTRVGSEDIAGSTDSGTSEDGVTWDGTPTGPWQTIALGITTLPPTDVPENSTAVVRLTLDSIALPSQVEVGQVWSFYLGDDAAISQVDCGTGTPEIGVSHNRLFLESPNLRNQGRQRAFVGTQPDRADAFHATGRAAALDIHQFVPKVIQLYTITPGAPWPKITLRHRPAHFQYAPHLPAPDA